MHFYSIQDWFLYFATKQEFVWTILIPMALSISFTIGAIIRNEIPKIYILLWLIFTPLSIFVSFWEINHDSIALHIFPLYTSVALIISLFIQITLRVVYASTYFSLLSVDILACFIQGKDKYEVLQYAYGIGGAGPIDTLFLGPVIAIFAFWFVNRHREKERAMMTKIISFFYKPKPQEP